MIIDFFSMQKDRRGFIKNCGSFILGVSVIPIVSSLSGCEDYGDISGGNTGGNTGGTGGGLEIDKFEITHPYALQNFSLGNAVTDRDGVFDYNSGRARLGYPKYIVNNLHQGIKGAEVWIYEEGINRSSLVSVVDPSGIYMPKTFSLSASGMKGLEGMDGRWWVLDKVKDAIGKGRAKIKDYVEAALPSWDWENINDNPGAIYTGDWSMNEIKNWTHLLEKSSAIITKVFPPAAVVYSVFATAGKVVDVLDDAIDAINRLSLGDKFKIDKNKKHSLFVPGHLLNPALIMMEPIQNTLKRMPGDIKDFFITEPDFSWSYRNNCSGPLVFSEVLGKETFNGKEVVAIDEGGIKSYYAFSGGKLGYVGFNFPSLGDVVFDPPICIGDSNIMKGKVYSGTSKVSIEKRQDLSGEIKEVFDYQDREIVEDCSGNPYGGCFKIRETCDLTLNGQTTSMGGAHWFAKDIGKIKVSNDSGTFRLVDYSGPNLGGRMSQKTRGGRNPQRSGRFGLVDLILSAAE